MAQVAIVTDSVADIPDPILRELGITSVPTFVRFGDRVFRDKVDLSVSEFYKRLSESSTLPATSQPPPSAFEQVYRQLAQQTDEIITITTTARLSGIYSSAVVGAQNVPGVRIEVIDSKQATMAVGWIVILAARAARAGARLEEIKALVEDTIPRAHVMAMLNTLEYAQRGGRLGKGAALIGTLLNVKPIISLIDGEVQPIEKVRTARRAAERLIEIVLASGPIQELAVMHAAGLELAQQLKNSLSAHLPDRHILIGETGPVLGTHVGPGAVGIAWINGK